MMTKQEEEAALVADLNLGADAIEARDMQAFKLMLRAVEMIRNLQSDRDSWAEQADDMATMAHQAGERVRELEAVALERQQSLDMQWKASQRAIKMWQDAHPGNDMVWPDQAHLCVWLMERIAALESGAVADIVAERRRQREVEGWTPEHDDEHTAGDLAMAGAAYAYHAAQCDRASHHHCIPVEWPWEDSWWKPKDRKRDLVRAAALLVAEIERTDRALLATPAKEPT